MQQHHISSLLKKSLHTLSDQVRSGKVIKVSDIKEVCALLAFELRRQTFVRYQATKLIDGEYQFTKDYSDPITAINSDFTTYDHDRGRQITFTLQNAQQDHALNAVFRHLQFFDTEGITDEQQDSCQESRGILPEVKLQTDGGVIHFDQTNLRFVYDANELLEEVKPMARAMREHIIQYIAKQEELQRLKELEMEDLPDLEQEGDSNLESDTP